MDCKRCTVNLCRIAEDLVELLLHDSKEYHQEQEAMKLKIEQHLASHGQSLRDASLLLASEPLPTSMKCITLTSYGPRKNTCTTRNPLVLPIKNQVLIRAYSW